MAFNSTVFLFLFLPAALAVYYVIPKKCRGLRNYALLALSLGFYFFGETKAIFILLAGVTINWLAGLAAEKWHRPAVIAAVVANVALLSYYKYLAFAVETVNSCFGTGLSVPEILMPLGISFFTFQGLSYVFDISAGRAAAEKNPLRCALYICMFPQLASGPIARWRDIAPQLDGRVENFDRFYLGTKRFMFGLAKKMLLADALGMIASEVYAMPTGNLPMMTAWIGAIAYTLQIFYDFSGYSDMAIGIAKLFGFDLPENFNYPYVAASITDFWRRWHMSLSSWFRDYIYIPLGGNRKGKIRQLLNIAVVWALTGLWHGANWTFVMWGLYFAAILMIEKLFLLKAMDRLWKPIRHIYALILIVIGWVIFSQNDLNAIGTYLSAMFSFRMGGADYARYVLAQYKLELCFGVLLTMPMMKILPERIRESKAFELAGTIATIAVFAVALLAVENASFTSFIYFRF